MTTDNNDNSNKPTLPYVEPYSNPRFKYYRDVSKYIPILNLRTIKVTFYDREGKARIEHYYDRKPTGLTETLPIEEVEREMLIQTSLGYKEIDYEDFISELPLDVSGNPMYLNKKWYEFWK